MSRSAAPIAVITKRRAVAPVSLIAMRKRASGRQRSTALGPFHQDQSVRGKMLFHAEFEKLVIVAQTVGVNMDDRAPAVVFLHQHERGADRGAGLYTGAGSDGLH